MSILDIVKPGVVTGEDVQKVFAYAKENAFALPAVNCVGTDSCNAVLEAGAKAKSPVIIQFSNGGANFVAGKTVITVKFLVLSLVLCMFTLLLKLMAFQ